MSCMPCIGNKTLLYRIKVEIITRKEKLLQEDILCSNRIKGSFTLLSNNKLLCIINLLIIISMKKVILTVILLFVDKLTV